MTDGAAVPDIRELNACRAFFSRRERHTSRRGREISTPTTRAVIAALLTVVEDDDDDEVVAADDKEEAPAAENEVDVAVATVVVFVSSFITMPFLDRFCPLSAVEVVIMLVVS